jgi:imidazole glycerol-phosphate synthase subunit HisH
MIGIVDLDMGNLRSISNAISATGNDPRILDSPDGFDDVSHLILPGVGAFRVAMSHMEERRLLDPIRAFAEKGKPVLGLCLGMQLLASTGDEGGLGSGVDLVAGHVTRFDEERVPSIPHVGWNDVHLTGSHPVLDGLREGVDFYFVHSYRFVPSRDEDVVGWVEYGEERYPAIVASRNVVGFQFHPEKSQRNGLRLLENFCDWDGRC